MKGAYILLIVIEKEVNIEIGALGTIHFEKGHYCYVGSAVGPGGIEARVGRHLKKRKRLKWHIDYLLEHGDIEEAYYSSELSEMEIVHYLSEKFDGIPGFGSSDSPFETHLFICEKDELMSFLRAHPFHVFL